jgi:peptidoglycan lytic transglycosylase
MHYAREPYNRLCFSLERTSRICVLAVLFAAAGLGSAQAWEPKSAFAFSTAALNPPDLRIEQEAGVPQPIAPADAQRYRQIFALQRGGSWAAADRLIANLVDRRLLGTVLAQRYLHPTAYRSKYPELVAWLKRYPDNAEAPQIFALALQRQPAGAPPPPRPETTVTISNGGLAEYDLDADFGMPAKGGPAPKLRAWLDRAMERDQLDAARARLAGRAAEAALGPVETDAYRSLLAAQYYYRGDPAKALPLARAAAQRSGDAVPLAYWMAGLAAWRQGDLEEARRDFEALADAPRVSPWMVSAAAYWASRVHLKARRPHLVGHWLAHAAEFPRTFYGQLARRCLDLPASFDWQPGPFTDVDVTVLMANPAGQRAAALLQVGESKTAERELEAMALSDGPETERAALALAQRANLAQLAIRLGPRVAAKDGRRHDSALYPVPPWRPSEGFTVDRALLYALMRQESGFRPDARSPVGATGVMQLMPATAAFIAKGASLKGNRPNLLDPAVNMALGQRYVAYLFGQDAVHGDLFRLVAAYNSGPGKLEQWQARDDFNDDPLLFIESLPSHETRAFIERVLASYWIYRDRLGEPTPSLDAIAAGEWPTYTPLEDGGKAVAENGPN